MPPTPDPRALRPHRLSLAPLLLLVLLQAVPPPARAEFWPKGDWKNRKHHLTVCLKGNNCPAGMADSVQAAINLWNADSLTWRFAWTTDCDQADIVISCQKQRPLGNTNWSYTSSENTSAKVQIKSDADWGWCDDKYELVSTLVHELGHCARLKDTNAADQSKAMRGSQNKAGHARGPSSADSAEAAESDTALVPTTVTNPPNAQKQLPFTGTLVPAPGTWPFDLERALHFELRALAPGVLHILEYAPIDANQIQWQAVATPPGPTMELFYLVIQYPESTSVREGILYVTDVPWQPTWGPHAVAPPDTTVPDDTSEIVLYPYRSTHSGNQHLAFGWTVDGTEGLQAEGEALSVRLPAGLHQVKLDAVDEAGLQSEDSMVVAVLATAAVGGGPAGRLRLDLPVPFRLGRPMQVTYELPAQGEASLAVYDIQGRLVRTLVSGAAAQGRHTLQWDLTDAGGRRLGAGVYFCALRSGGAALMRKMVLIR